MRRFVTSSIVGVAAALVVASAVLPARADIPPGPPPTRPTPDPNATPEDVAPEPPKRPVVNESGGGCSAPGQLCATLALVLAAVFAQRAASAASARRAATHSS